MMAARTRITDAAQSRISRRVIRMAGKPVDKGFDHRMVTLSGRKTECREGETVALVDVGDRLRRNFAISNFWNLAERRVVKESVRTCSTRWSPLHHKTQIKKTTKI